MDRMLSKKGVIALESNIKPHVKTTTSCNIPVEVYAEVKAEVSKMKEQYPHKRISMDGVITDGLKMWLKSVQLEKG